ncbi:hypothetical protein BH11PSE7_BH11PSE7_24930 [soil metagenome]
MKSLKLVAFAMLTLLAVPQAFACYTVYAPNNQIIYNAVSPPVDMSYQIHQVLPRVFPGGHMVFGDDPNCPLVSAVYVRTVAAGADESRMPARRLRAKPDRN